MPNWAGDGKSLLYTKYPIARPAQTWRDHLDGTPPVPLGGTSNGQYFPTFIRNGTAVRTLHIVPGQPTQAIQDILLADGSVTTHPLDTPLIAQPFFSSDGRTIGHHSLDPIHQVWKLDMTTGQRTQLTSVPIPHGFASLSPDGQWVQLQRILRGSTEVWILPANGCKRTPLIDRPGIWYAGGWSGDAKELVVAGNSGNGWALHAVARETRNSGASPRTSPFANTSATPAGPLSTTALPTSTTNPRETSSWPSSNSKTPTCGVKS